MCSVIFSEMLQFGSGCDGAGNGVLVTGVGQKRLCMLQMHKVENGSRAGDGRHKTPYEFSRGCSHFLLCLCMAVTDHSRAVQLAVGCAGPMVHTVHSQALAKALKLCIVGFQMKS